MPLTPKPASRPRRFERHHVDRRVTVTADKPGRGKIGGRCDTLSEGGLGAMLAGELEIGEAATVELTYGPTNARQSLTFRAVVRNKSGFHHGLEFLNITASVRKQVKVLVDAEPQR